MTATHRTTTHTPTTRETSTRTAPTRPTRTRPAGTHEPTDVLIDAENIYPGGWWRYDTAQLSSRLHAVLALAPPHARVLVVCCPDLAARLLDVVLATGVDLRVVAPTPDAADLLLAHHLAAAPRHAHILLVTGDGGLTDAVAHHVARGGRVTLAAVPGQLSTRLQAAANTTHLLHPATRPSPAPTHKAAA